MKAEKLAIRPWLSCQYNENTLVDLPSSVTKTAQNRFKLWNDFSIVGSSQQEYSLIEKRWLQSKRSIPCTPY